ncbi:MAG TPA: tRNA epoxyqueuosine(34) reductase QueG [Clostridia bacterium]
MMPDHNCKSTGFGSFRIDMKKKLAEYCRSLDIGYVGIAPAEPYHDFGKTWRRQVEKGYISGFEERDTAKRVYPELTLEDARSVIVCLFPYYTKTDDHPETGDDPGTDGRANIAKYARSIDYHIIIMEKLERIAMFLEDNIDGFRWKAFADSGPFSDRYLAWKAGLGFRGINGHIITDKYGSYVFIGYILNNFPFEADDPQDRTCLQCLECVRKCPGQCIMGDFTINPKRCKSYITQKKGGLSPEDIQILKKHDLIWGCDVCQDVCPHNRNVHSTPMKEFREDLLYSVDIDGLKRISNREFRKKYGNRSFSWRGKEILIRNHEIIHGR